MDPNEQHIESSGHRVGGSGLETSSTLNPNATEFRPLERNPPGFPPPGVWAEDLQTAVHPSISPVVHPHHMIASNAGPYVTYVPNFPFQYPTMPVQFPALNPPPLFGQDQYGMLSYPQLQSPPQGYPLPMSTDHAQPPPQGYPLPMSTDHAQPPPQGYPLLVSTDHAQNENNGTTSLQQKTRPTPKNRRQIKQRRKTPVIKPLKRTKRPAGWPEGHPPISDLNFYGFHPSKVPDSVFLGEKDNPFLKIHDPFASGSFDASRTPWWTHWLIAIAHACTSMPQTDIWMLYKWRYRDVIPNVNHLTIGDEMELSLHIEENKDRYAFDWEERDEPRLTQLVYQYMEQACKAEYLKAKKEEDESSK